MKTTHKIGAARMIYHAVHAGRTLLGRTDQDVVVRDGINYELDLSQGIDFAIASLVLDIGAHVGAHTLHLDLAQAQNGGIIAFEPTDFALRKLSRNLELNPQLANRVTPLPLSSDRCRCGPGSVSHLFGGGLFRSRRLQAVSKLAN